MAVIRVLHVTGGLEPELGGPSVSIPNFVAATASPRVELHLLAAINDRQSALAADLRERMRCSGIGISLVQRTWRLGGRMSRWGISIALVRWLALHSRDFDVIVMHGAWMFSSLAALAAGRLAGKACVLIPHESLTEFDVNRKGSIARIRAKTVLKRMYGRHCQLFVFTSNAEAGESFPSGSRAASIVVRLPLFADRVAPSPRLRRATGSPLRVGYMGRLHPKKNVDVLLKAMALLPESFSLAIGGDGPAQLRASLESLASKLGIQERVTWSGFISATEKDDFFDSIDVLVMCSDFESFGIVAAEAMMRGVPALVSPTTGAAELIHGNGGGLVVPPTPEAVAQALSRLDRDADMMEKLSVQAIKASEQLSFSHVGPQMLELYLDLVRAVSPKVSTRIP